LLRSPLTRQRTHREVSTRRRASPSRRNSSQPPSTGRKLLGILFAAGSIGCIAASPLHFDPAIRRLEGRAAQYSHARLHGSVVWHAALALDDFRLLAQKCAEFPSAADRETWFLTHKTSQLNLFYTAANYPQEIAKEVGFSQDIPWAAADAFFDVISQRPEAFEPLKEKLMRFQEYFAFNAQAREASLAASKAEQDDGDPCCCSSVRFFRSPVSQRSIGLRSHRKLHFADHERCLPDLPDGAGESGVCGGHYSCRIDARRNVVAGTSQDVTRSATAQSGAEDSQEVIVLSSGRIVTTE
jgi:hypothetical protein